MSIAPSIPAWTMRPRRATRPTTQSVRLPWPAHGRPRAIPSRPAPRCVTSRSWTTGGPCEGRATAPRTRWNRPPDGAHEGTPRARESPRAAIRVNRTRFRVNEISAARDELAGQTWWRWRESNPRPMTGNQGFSGRILHLIFSAPTITQTSRGRAQSPDSPRGLDDEGRRAVAL